MSDEVWMQVHQNHGMIQIVRKLYLVKTNNWSYLAIPKDGRLNQRKN